MTSPGETDTLMIVMGVVLVVAVLGIGILFLRLHTLPERIAHKTHKLQFEIVAVLGLISLFTHMHIFWIIGLLLALVDLPDFSGFLGRIAGSVEKIAGVPPGQGDAGVTHGIGDELVPDGPVAAAAAHRDAHILPGEILPKDGDGSPPPQKRRELAATGTRG